MLLKWLITSALMYGIYRYFIRPTMVEAPPQNPASPENKEGEFIDYEEVE